jgi:pimeloyl-ACP methyl ester carboxylesterase
MTTFLLVHGAWHRPAMWDDLRRELHALGHRTVAPALPSAGRAPVAGMYEDAAVVRRELEQLAGPVVVVAHSYGGIPATQALGEAAGAADVVHAVFLAAYLLDVDESLYSIHGVPDPEVAEGLFPLVDDPRHAFYGDLPDARAEQEVTRLVCQTRRSFVDRVTSAGWHGLPTTYVVCEQDQALRPEFQEKLAVRAGDVRRLPSGHSPFLSMPAELAAVLHEVAPLP